MEFLISGQAGVIASLGKEACLYTLDGDVLGRGVSANAAWAFIGCTDVSKIRATALNDAVTACKASWQADRALRMFLMLIDDDEPAEDLPEYAECLEELIEAPGSQDILCRSLYSAPLPTAANITRLYPMISSFPLVDSLLEQILNDQVYIRFVRSAFDDVPISFFGTNSLRAQFIEQLISADAFQKLVVARRDGKNADFEIIRIMSRLRHIEGAREIIDKWTSGMRTAISRLPALAPDDDDDVVIFENPRGVGLKGQAAYENARRQQYAIIEQLKRRDIDGARRFADDLISLQTLNSTREHLGKSLSLLSQRAKEHGVPELHLEWAQRATEINPEDPKTFGHLVDALINASRFNEASVILDVIESLGGELFAENGRARILRDTGRLDEARAKYLSAARSHSVNAESTHSLAGAAEVLRDLMRYDEALSEYQNLTKIAPLDPIAWAGLASVLMDMGRFDEAIVTFGRASTHGNGLVPRNGRATAYKLAGNFQTALRLYDDLIRDFPNDPVALCGRAGVYRAMGFLDEAKHDYETAIARSPFTPTPISGLVEIVREQGDLQNALDIAANGAQRFPMHAGLAAARAGILKQQALYVDALAVYDEIIRKFPFDNFLKLSRAEVLRRMGNDNLALLAYDELLERQSSFAQARLAKASLLVQLRKFDEAERLLPSGPVRSQIDWSFQLIAAYIAAGRRDYKKSLEIIRAGSERSPFSRQRRLFRSAWAQSELDRGHASSALKILEPAPNDISNVLRLHALAASGRTELAKRAFSEISSTEGTEPFRDISSAIAKSFKLVEGGVAHARSWIFEAETREILFEASVIPARYDLAA
jgi:tetratricopeptide (TPR) repeat protein